MSQDNRVNPQYESTQNLDKIAEIQAKLLSQDFDLDSFMDLVVNETQTLTTAIGVVLELVEGDLMVYRAATGTAQEFLGLKLPKKNSLSGLCVESQQVLISNDTENDSRVNLEACRKVHARSMVVAPLFHNGVAVGVLKILSDKESSFTETDVNLLKIMAGFLGSALYRNMLSEFKNFI